MKFNKTMADKLLIVESPSKAKTLRKYLGSGYEVGASMGHIRDLPSKTLGVDTVNSFRPTYITIPGKEAQIRQLKAMAKGKVAIFLASDPGILRTFSTFKMPKG